MDDPQGKSISEDSVVVNLVVCCTSEEISEFNLYSSKVLSPRL